MQNELTEEKTNWRQVLTIPTLMVAAMWAVFYIDPLVPVLLKGFGVQPRTAEGLIGILTMPLLHGSFEHLISNTLPMWILGALIFLHYKEVAPRIYIFSWLITGFWVWVMARPHTNHIGASGMVYAFTSFLFFSGIFRKHKQLIAVSFFVVFLYGGLLWGIFPIDLEPYRNTSWEGHLAGGMAGLLLAIYYRKVGKQRQPYAWELEDDEEEEDDPGFDDWKLPPQPIQPGQREVVVRYIYRPRPRPNTGDGKKTEPKEEDNS